MAAALGQDVTTLPPFSLHLTDYLPPVPPVVPFYERLKIRAKQHLLSDWATAPAPSYYPCSPLVDPHPFMGLGKFVAGRIHQLGSGKSYFTEHHSWDNPDPGTSCPHFSQIPQSFQQAILS